MRFNMWFHALSAVAGCMVAAAASHAATSAYWRFEDIVRRPYPPFDTIERPPAELAELFTASANGPSDLTSDDSTQTPGPNPLPTGPNQLRTFNNSATGNTTSPFWIADVPAGTVTQSGASNLRSVFFPDGAPFTDDIYTVAGAPISTADFSAYTIEASFKTTRLGSFQTIMGKDGPTARAFLDNSGQLIDPQPPFDFIPPNETTAPEGTFELGYSPFQMKMIGSNFSDYLTDAGDGDLLDKLVIELVDDAGDGNVAQNLANPGIHRLVSDAALLADTWYSVAVVNDGTTASLYLKEGAGAYVLQDTEAVSGAFGGKFNDADAGNFNGLWTVGRGFLTRFQHQPDDTIQPPDENTLPDRVFQGDIRDWFQGYVDEVRISDTALAPSSFLFSEAPTGDADFDDDGDVDGADFLTWQRGLGSAGGNSIGDADGDGTVTGNDLAVWKQQFGSGASTAAAGAIPEPSSLLTSLVATAIVGAARRRRCRTAGRSA